MPNAIMPIVQRVRMPIAFVNVMRRAIAVLLLTASLLPFLTDSPAAPEPPQRPTFRSSVDIIYVNVIVRDKNGQPVRGLTGDDFVITEDGRPQAVRTFAYEEVTTSSADANAANPNAATAADAADAA